MRLLAIIAFLSCSLLSYSQSPRPHTIPFDSLRMQVNQAQNSRKKIDAYMKLGSAFSRARMSDSLFYYSQKIDTTENYGKAGKNYLEGMGHYSNNRLRQAIALLEQARTGMLANNEDAYLIIQNTLGICYMRTDNLDKAKSAYMDMLEVIGDEAHPRKSGVFGNLGMVHRNLGDYNQAIECFEQCVALNPEDAFTVANSYMSIAGMFYNLEMYDKAIATLLLADSTKILNTPVYIAYNSNLADNYYKKGQFDLAKHYFNKTRQQAIEMRQFHLAVKPNIFLAKMAMEDNDLATAKERIDEGMEANKHRPYLPMQIAIRLCAVEYYLNAQLPDSAIYVANKVIDMASEKRASHMLKNVYELMSQAYEQLNDTDNSNRYLKRHTAFTDSISRVGQQRILADARARYEVRETQEALDETHEQASFFESLSVKIGVVVVVLCVLCIFLYAKFFKQKQVNALNQKQIDALNKQLKEVQETMVENEAVERLLLKSKAVLDMADIMYIKSDGPYVEFYINRKERPEIDRNTLKALIEELPSGLFVQVHRSYIVNINFVRSIYATKLLLKSGEDINISRSFKANIEKILMKPAA